MLGICRISPSKDSASCKDAKEKDRIIDVIEGMDTDTISTLETFSSKSCGKLTYKSAGLSRAHGSCDIGCVKEDLKFDQRLSQTPSIEFWATGLSISYSGASKT